MIVIAELERMALDVVIRDDAVCAVVDVEPSGRLADGSPSGYVVDADGTRRQPRTTYGAAWLIDGLRRSKPFATFDDAADLYAFLDLLQTGSTSRSRPRSVAGTGAHSVSGPAEGGRVPAADLRAVVEAPADAGAVAHAAPAQRRRSGVRGASDAAGSPPGIPSQETARSSPPELDAVPAGAVAVTAPAARTCKACGLSLEGRAIRTRGPLRETCDDACRQAYRRGARAPEAGVVTPAAIEVLSRIPKPAHQRLDPADAIAHGEDHP